MSCSLSSKLLYRFIVLLGIALLLAGFSTSAMAQKAGGITGTSSVAVKYTYIIAGTKIEVDPSGSPIKYSGRCPFDILAMAGHASPQYIAAVEAAKKANEPNMCPFAVNTQGHRIYLSNCGQFYEDASASLNPVSHPDMNTVCCHLSAEAIDEEGNSERSLCQQDLVMKTTKGKVAENRLAKVTKTLSSDALTAEERDKIQKEREARDKLEKQCFGTTLETVGKFWAQKQEVKCVKDVIKLFSSKRSEVLSKETLKDIQNLFDASKESMVYGFTSGPSWLAIAANAVVKASRGIIKAAKLVLLASQAAEELSSCHGIVPGLSELGNFRTTIMDNFSCKAVQNLVERQLTQCIRVSFSASAVLPQFQLQLQCPVNINIAANLSSTGFTSNTSVTAGCPVQASFGRYSMLNQANGLKSLFNGDCFKINSGSNNGSSGGVGGGNSTAVQRVPGVDCGPLDERSALKKEIITGKKYLSSGTAVENGWVAGDTEAVQEAVIDQNTGDVKMVDTSFRITRCDYYENGNALRKTYVYGTGASCNSGSAGFLDGGYETNTACYIGAGYTPAGTPNVPDACLYPADCLDNSGIFNESRLGTGNCAKGTKPNFDENRQYLVNTSRGGGIGGNGQAATYKRCTDFNGKSENSTYCCNPQLENCSLANANVPICKCDSGDRDNYVADAASGACFQSGKKSCCSPRLNGEAFCNSQKVKLEAGLEICEDEKSDQCTTNGQFLGADGNLQNIPPAQLVKSKPSPMMYLFIRADGKMGDTQCCTTEWCNVCPQHYANAYGLSLAGAEVQPAQNDAGNHALLGTGWPFESYTNQTNGDVSYRPGIAPLSYKIKLPLGNAKTTVRYPRLFLSKDIMSKPSPNQIDACNNLPGSARNWQVSYAPTGLEGNMGYVYNASLADPDEPKWTNIGTIGNMEETPMAYYNRIRTSYSSSAAPIEQLKLCSEVGKVCYPGQQAPITPPVYNDPPSNGSGGGIGGGTVPATNTPARTTSVDAVSNAPDAATTSSTSTAAPSAVPSATSSSPGATAVPSAGNSSAGQANGSLY